MPDHDGCYQYSSNHRATYLYIAEQDEERRMDVINIALANHLPTGTLQSRMRKDERADSYPSFCTHLKLYLSLLLNGTLAMLAIYIAS